MIHSKELKHKKEERRREEEERRKGRREGRRKKEGRRRGLLYFLCYENKNSLPKHSSLFKKEEIYWPLTNKLLVSYFH